MNFTDKLFIVAPSSGKQKSLQKFFRQQWLPKHESHQVLILMDLYYLSVWMTFTA